MPDCRKKELLNTLRASAQTLPGYAFFYCIGHLRVRIENRTERKKI